MALLDDKGLKYFVGKLMERFAPKSHTHTKSQITDFPKSMPANGGNSTTVNGHSVNSDVPAGAKFTDTTYTNFVGATANASGKAGLVPAPSTGATNLFLRSDGTWGSVAEKQTSITIVRW